MGKRRNGKVHLSGPHSQVNMIGGHGGDMAAERGEGVCLFIEGL